MAGLQTDRNLLQLQAKAKGRGTGYQGTEIKRTCFPAADGFLSHRFMPVARDRNLLDNWQEKERGFFASLAFLCSDFGFAPLKSDIAAFPYNIVLARDFVKGRMAKLHDKTVVLMESKGLPRLATAQPHNTGRTLFYIPLKPLWKLQRDRRRRQEANLLLSIYAYLFQRAQIPLYTIGGFVAGCYESLSYWMEENVCDWEAVELYKCRSEMAAAIYFGQRSERTLRHPCHLADWKRRLEGYGKHNPSGTKFLEIASRFYGLYRRFPKHIYDRNIFFNVIEPQEEYRICPDWYISFVWSNEGWLAEQTVNYLNIEAQECMVTEEPLLLTCYDRKGGRVVDTLDFEKELFGLFEELMNYFMDDEND